jgi:hypothetical protein
MLRVSLPNNLKYFANLTVLGEFSYIFIFQQI